MCNIIHSKQEFIKNTIINPNPKYKPTKEALNISNVRKYHDRAKKTNVLQLPLSNEDIMTNYGMLDSGTTGHFIAVNANVKNYKAD